MRFVVVRMGNLLGWTPGGRVYGLALVRGILLEFAGCLNVDLEMVINVVTGGSDEARPLGNASGWDSSDSSGITGCFRMSGYGSTVR